MTNKTFIIDSKKSLATDKFHTQQGLDLYRYHVTVKGDGKYQGVVGYYLNGYEDIDGMFKWLHQQKVVKEIKDKYDGTTSEFKEFIDSHNIKVSIVDMALWADGKEYYILRNKELDRYVDHFIYKVENNEL